MAITVEQHLALEEIAKAQNVYYAPNRTHYIFVILTSSDLMKLERYRELFHGTIYLTVHPTGNGLMRLTNIERGDYMWVLRNYEAYTFCRRILPYLAKHDRYRFDFCQACMMEYMTREDYPDERDDAETA